jgi:hypothetical protein
MNKFSDIELDEMKLAEETLQYIFNIQNTYLNSILYMEILDPREKYGDLHQHIDFLKERLSHLEFSTEYSGITFKNSLSRYTQFKYDKDGGKVDDSGVLVNLKLKIEEFSKEIFWANGDEEKSFQKLDTFESFIDIFIPKEERLRKLVTSPFFNIDDWILYYQNLLDLKFPEFAEKLTSGKSVIKYRLFKDNFYLGIESDYQDSRKAFKKGWWETPEYKLVIFKKLTGKKIQRMVVFDNFVHPFFRIPAFDFKVFFAVKTTHQISENEYVLDNGTKTDYLDDGTVRLYNSEEFGDNLKRHAYFYYDMLSHTTRGYIKFIEESFNPGDE